MTRPCVQFIAVADDLGLEGVENVTLVLSAPSNVQLRNGSLEVLIQDTDGMCHCSLLSLAHTVFSHIQLWRLGSLQWRKMVLKMKKY